MENAIYCVWCGSENPSDGQKCCKCGKKLDGKENLLRDFLVEHTKDKLKGDIDGTIYDALKNYLLSHLYSVIIAVAFAVTAVAAVVTAATPDPADHIVRVEQAPIVQQPTQPTQPTTEALQYVLTQEDKDEIYTCLRAFTDCMEVVRYIGGYDEFLQYVISEELEVSVGYDSYTDMYPDVIMDDIYHYNSIQYSTLVIDEETWSTEPLTENGKELLDMGYTIATVYVDWSFYGKRIGMSNAPTELLGDPRYLMTFTIENGKWLLVEQINVKERMEERQDAFL